MDRVDETARVEGDFEFLDESALRDEFWNIERGDVVIDVGCGYGSYTVSALAAGATVYAVDSDGLVLGALERRAACSRLVTIHVALYNGGQYPLALINQIEGGVLKGPDPFDVDDADEVAHELERVDWIKIDVEGGEAGVLRGAVKTLRRFHPRLLIEDHSTIYPWVARSRSAERIWALLTKLGYQIRVVPYVGSGIPRGYFVCSWPN